MDIKWLSIHLLALVGAILLAKNCLLVLNFLYKFYIRPSQNVKKFGAWAVVTGATDGIGQAYAYELARKGLNIIVISRTESKLQNTCKYIQEKYGVKTDYLALDMTNLTEKDYQKVEAVFNKYDVGILVNNAGMSQESYHEFREMPLDRLEAIIKINCIALTRLMHIAINNFKPKKRGCIINMSSGTSSSIPVAPYSAEYGASKSYVDAISKSVAIECANYGVRINCQSPLYVVTKLSKIRRPSFFTPTPEVFARAAVKDMGYESFSSPYVTHSFERGLLSCIPTPLLAVLWSYFAVNLSSKAKAKRERLAKEQKSQ